MKYSWFKKPVSHSQQLVQYNVGGIQDYTVFSNRWSATVGCGRISKAGRATPKYSNGACGLSSIALGVNGWVQGNSSRAVLPLTRHQCNIHCENSRVDHGASKWRWALQTACGTQVRIEYTETELNLVYLIMYRISVTFSQDMFKKKERILKPKYLLLR